MSEILRGACISGAPDKRKVGRAFSAAAERYDRLARLQRAAADRLIAQLTASVSCCGAWLDVGTGTGYCARLLRRRFPDARPIAIDLAEGMLGQVRRMGARGPLPWLVAGDAEALPFAEGSVDLVISNLALQWCPEPANAFGEFARVLKPDGRLFFSTFGPGTLFELRESWARADRHNHVNHFRSAKELRAIMAERGLEPIGVEPEIHVLRYAGVASLMAELKGLGAHNVTAGRPRGLTGKSGLTRMIDAYREQYSAADGRIEASFEVIYGTAKPVIR